MTSAPKPVGWRRRPQNHSPLRPPPKTRHAENCGATFNRIPAICDNNDNSTIVLASFFLSTVWLSSSFVLWDFFKFFAFTFGIAARCSVFLRLLVTAALVLSTIGLVAFFDEMLQVSWQREFVWHLRFSFQFRHS